MSWSFHFDRNVSLRPIIATIRPARVWLLSDVNYTRTEESWDIAYLKHNGGIQVPASVPKRPLHLPTLDLVG
jgi:hypothetical protein